MVNQSLSAARLAFLVLMDTYLHLPFEEDMNNESKVLSKEEWALKSVEFLLNPAAVNTFESFLKFFGLIGRTEGNLLQEAFLEKLEGVLQDSTVFLDFFTDLKQYLVSPDGEQIEVDLFQVSPLSPLGVCIRECLQEFSELSFKSIQDLLEGTRQFACGSKKSILSWIEMETVLDNQVKGKRLIQNRQFMEKIQFKGATSYYKKHYCDFDYYLSVNEWSQALASLQRFLDLNTAWPDTHHPYALSYLAGFYIHFGQYELAKRTINNALPLARESQDSALLSNLSRDKINLDAECSSPLRDQAKEWSKVGDIDLFLLVQKLYEVSQPVPCQNDFCCEPQNKNTSEAFPIIRSDLLDKLTKSEDYLNSSLSESRKVSLALPIVLQALVDAEKRLIRIAYFESKIQLVDILLCLNLPWKALDLLNTFLPSLLGTADSELKLKGHLALVQCLIATGETDCTKLLKPLLLSEEGRVRTSSNRLRRKNLLLQALIYNQMGDTEKRDAASEQLLTLVY